LFFLIWPLHCLSLFNLQLLITSLVSSNFYCCRTLRSTIIKEWVLVAHCKTLSIIPPLFCCNCNQTIKHPITPVFRGFHVTRSLVLCVMFCKSLFILWSFFFWPLSCLFFFDLRILITSLVSSNSSYCNFVTCVKTMKQV
jgi:hypothetical protein